MSDIVFDDLTEIILDATRVGGSVTNLDEFKLGDTTVWTSTPPILYIIQNTSFVGDFNTDANKALEIYNSSTVSEPFGVLDEALNGSLYEIPNFETRYNGDKSLRGVHGKGYRNRDFLNIDISKYNYCHFKIHVDGRADEYMTGHTLSYAKYNTAKFTFRLYAKNNAYKSKVLDIREIEYTERTSVVSETNTDFDFDIDVSQLPDIKRFDAELSAFKTSSSMERYYYEYLRYYIKEMYFYN